MWGTRTMMNQQQQHSPRQAESGPSQTTPMGHEFPTKGHLPEETRRMSIEILNHTLADTTDLLTQVKFAHWNVRGPNFYQLHELFEELAERLSVHADDIAERTTALGGQAMGTVRLAAANSGIPEMRTDTISGQEYVELIADRLAIHDENLYDCLQEASERNDLDTADLLNEISRDISKYRWFLEAHFITEPTGGMRTGGMETGGMQSRMEPGMESPGMQSGMESSGMGTEMRPGMDSGGMESIGMESAGMRSGTESGSMEFGGTHSEGGSREMRPQMGDTQSAGGHTESHGRADRHRR